VTLGAGGPWLVRLAQMFGVTCIVALGSIGLSSLPREQFIAGYTTPLDGRSRSQRHNARLAMEHLNGALIPPGATFSFLGAVGSFSRDEGFRRAPVSYNGQLIDDWGGGVCQTSTTLYNAALLAGLDIVERHRHQFWPSYVPPGRDAAVAFSDIDLRFRNPYDFPIRIRASMDQEMIRIGFLAPQALKQRPLVYEKVLESEAPSTFRIGPIERPMRVRNSGKEGVVVAVYRKIGNTTELISSDAYPVMHRVVEDR
jgi:vancomycin resistance protein YoaR